MKILYFFFLFCLTSLPNLMAQETDFLQYQLSQPRVSQANAEKIDIIKSRFMMKGVSFPSSMVYWRAFKWNKTLELWAFHEDSQRYVMIHNYPICEIVGDLGPKRQEGDFQIPEGLYSITNFNPTSKYHLSLRVNYPNESDRILGKYGQLGGDIYIHGDCETIGCLPMTDDLIKEIYVINVYAKAAGQMDIPIHIFPTKMTLKNINKLKQEYFKDNTSLINFWNNLKEVYDFFHSKGYVPTWSVDSLNGRYVIEKE